MRIKEVNRMKSISFICLMLFVVTGPVGAQAPTSPEGFLGFKWESSVAEYAKLQDPPPEVLNSNPLASLYDRYTNLIEKKEIRFGKRYLRKIGEVEVGTTSYIFKRDKFCSADIDFKDERNYRVLKEALILKYGQTKEISALSLKANPQTRVGEKCTWRLSSVLIELQYNEMSGEGKLYYSYLPVLLEGIKKEKEDIQKTKNAL
jgi:hypothetical protein